MTLQLPYDGIGGPLPPKDDSRFEAELARRLEGIQGNFLELAGSVSGATLNRRETVPTEESTSSTSYTLLTTADRLSNVHVPEGGLLAVMYHASWKSSVAGAGRAAIFIGSNQLKSVTTGGTPSVQEVSSHSGLTNVYQLMGTYSAGLICQAAAGSIAAPGAYTGDVTTGQVAGGPRIDFYYRDSADGLGGGAVTEAQNVAGGGGPCYISFLPAGTYTVSVQFKATSGSVTVKNRKMWAWPLSF